MSVKKKTRRQTRNHRKVDKDRCDYVNEVSNTEFLWHRMKKYKVILSILIPVMAGTLYLWNFYEEHIPLELKVATQSHVKKVVDPVQRVAHLTRADQLRDKLERAYSQFDKLQIVKKPTSEQFQRVRRLKRLIKGLKSELCTFDKDEC